MSEEEIKEALEIIKQPITVNCKEYKYFDQKNYNNLIRVYDNCLWYVNTFNPYLEQLQQENKELKENYCNRTDCSSRIKDSKKYDSLQQRIDKAIEFVKTEHNTYPSAEDWRKALLKILEGDK